MSEQRHGLTGYDPRPNDCVAALCACGEEFTDTSKPGALEMLRAHFGEVQPTLELVDQADAAKPSSVRVILAHATSESGVRETVAVGPLMTTHGVMAARHVLEGSGAECEVVTLASVAQWCRAHGWTELRAVQPAERAEAGR